MGTITDDETGEVTDAGEFLGSQIEVDTFYDKEHGGISKLIGKELLFISFDERTSSFGGSGKFYTITAQANFGKDKKQDLKTVGFNTGSEVMMKQLDVLKQHLPVIGVIEDVPASSGYHYYQIRGAKKPDTT